MADTYKHCKRHNVEFNPDLGCLQCIREGQRQNRGKMALIKVLTYGNGASGELKQQEQEKEKSNEERI